jgi:hypothetical protein
MRHTRLFVFAATVACQPLAAQWRLASPASSPSARSGAGMCYDATASQIVLFGGTAGFSTSSETWSFDGTTWTLLAPVASPSGKTGVELVHDPLRGVTVMYGSMSTSFFGGPSVDQTWEFDGATWTQVFPTTTPGGLGNYGACFDSLRNRTVLYGGSSNSFFPIAESGTWEWNGTDWAQITTTGSPGPLERPAMCFHQGLGKTVLFGGIDPQVGGVDTTWLYDGANWTAAPITGSRPAVRTGAKLAYDSVRGVCVLTGGLDPTTGQPVLDTWEFDGTGWAQVPTATTGRYGSTIAFLPAVRRVVQFGGLDPVTFNDLGDTWLYGASSRVFGAGCAGSNGVPSLAAADAPRIGQNFTLTAGNLRVASPFAFLVIGLDDQTSPLGALPLSLAPFGMAGCSLLVSADASLLVPATAGAATIVQALPNDLGLVGVNLFHQVASIDPSANAGGLAVSNAHHGVVGN